MGYKGEGGEGKNGRKNEWIPKQKHRNNGITRVLAHLSLTKLSPKLIKPRGEDYHKGCFDIGGFIQKLLVAWNREELIFLDSKTDGGKKKSVLVTSGCHLWVLHG
jgi:hypothetical protein